MGSSKPVGLSAEPNTSWQTCIALSIPDSVLCVLVLVIGSVAWLLLKGIYPAIVAQACRFWTRLVPYAQRPLPDNTTLLGYVRLLPIMGTSGQMWEETLAPGMA